MPTGDFGGANGVKMGYNVTAGLGLSAPLLPVGVRIDGDCSRPVLSLQCVRSAEDECKQQQAHEESGAGAGRHGLDLQLILIVA